VFSSERSERVVNNSLLKTIYATTPIVKEKLPYVAERRVERAIQPKRLE
jgi:hypothetical protein